MKKILIIALLFSLAASAAMAQPKMRRNQAQESQQKTQNGALTTRAEISFPTSAVMDEDVVWRRDIYRELSLMDNANAGLYYPVEPVDGQMNFFTYIFKLMLSGRVPAYEYRLDGNEVFTDSARVRPLTLLDNYHIYYERVNGRLRIENSDIPSREVKSYYIKESAYYDQATATFHKKVIAICPIMSREDDFGDGSAKYPLFWMKYDDLAPYLSKQTIMTSDVNNAAVMSADDYFTQNMYKGEIYKTNNMLGRTLAQYCPNDSALKKEQQRIEAELAAFEKNVYGDQAKRDSLDSIAKAKTANVKAAKKSRTTNRRGNNQTVSKTKTKGPKTSSPQGSARVTVRRERH
ncbi:MAG: gliding motility protein GldN [Prevotella sp.]